MIMNEIFTRILQISEYQGFKSVNEFAKKGLGYSSSEKISRLKQPNALPSMEIIKDIANKFVNIDMNWFVTGSGKMLKSDNAQPTPTAEEPMQFYELRDESELLKSKNETIAILKQQNEDLRTDKQIFVNLINSKIFNNQ